MLAPGTRIDIDLAPGKPGAGLRFAVRSGDPTDLAGPATVKLAGIGRRSPFVNTGTFS